MKTKLSVQQYILMPVRGFRAIRPFSTSSVVNFFISIAGGGRVGPQAFGRQKSAPLKMRVLDSIHEDGPKLGILPVPMEKTEKTSLPPFQILDRSSI